jgi:hypothetical protein
LIIMVGLNASIFNEKLIIEIGLARMVIFG